MAGPSRSRRPPAPRRRAIRASAARVRPGAPEFTRPKEPWQKRVSTYYDEIGEIKDAAETYARMLSKLELYPAVMSEDGKSIQRVTDELVVGIIDRVVDPGGGRTQLQARYGTLMFLYGEAYLTVTFTKDGEEWEMLSGFELTVQNKSYIRSCGDGSPDETLDEVENPASPKPGEMMAWRLWRSHITQSGRADSPMHGVLNLCEQLIALDKAIRARGLSRIAGAGILAIPDEATLLGEQPDAFIDDDPDTPDPPAGDATETAPEDAFLKELTDSIVEPIKDPGTASAVVPLVIRVPGEYVDKIKHITFTDLAGYPEADQVDKTLRRIALALDMPPEEMLGKGDLNHWTGWLVSRELWQSRGMPVAERLCADLTKAYFQPALEALGVTTVTVDAPGAVDGETPVPGDAGADAVPTVKRQVTPQDVFIAFDDSAVVLNPDRAKDTKDAVVLGLIGDAAGRRELGFDELDAATPEEKAARIAARRGATSGGSGDQPSAVDEGAPASSIAASLRLAGAVELAIDRAREVAGSRVRSRLQGNPELAERYRDVASIDLPRHVGADTIHSLFGGPGCEQTLVAGAVDQILGRKLNGNRPVLLAAIEAAAARALYGDPVRLSPGVLALVAEEARGSA